MPIINVGSAPTQAEEHFHFTSEVALVRSSRAFTYSTFVQLAQPQPWQFTSLVDLKRTAASFKFTSRVLLLTSGSPLAGMPLGHTSGAAPVVPSVTCILGRAEKFEYEHTGENETAALTLKRARHEFPATLALSVAVRALPQFTAFLTVDERQWEETTTGGVTTTTVRLYNAAAQRASSRPLPELVPWVLAPRSEQEAKGPPPRRIGVPELVAQAAAAAKVPFVLWGVDPFSGETWMEGQRETSTEGKTFSAVFGETYGTAGFRLIVRNDVLIGLAPDAGGLRDFPILPPCAITSMTRRAEASRTPGLLRLSAADAHLPKPTLPEAAPATPASDQQQSWITRSFTDDVETISAGYVQDGLLRENQEVTRGTVIASENLSSPDQLSGFQGGDFEITPHYAQDGSVSSYTVTRTFTGVLISTTLTTFAYHPDCHEALIWQTTRKRSYGYTLTTLVEPRPVLGTMYSGMVSGGDVVADETETIMQEWYDSGELAGYQRTRQAAGTRLVAVQQQNAEGELLDRGPLQGREYAGQVLTDQYRRIGPVWQHAWSTTGGANVPVYDLESGEAVRLVRKTGTIQSGSEVMRNEPPKVNWPVSATAGGPATNLDDITVPQRQAFRVSGGGEAILTQSFSMLGGPTKLPLMAHLLAAANAPRVTTELSLRGVHGSLPGDNGVIGLHISLEGRTFATSLTLEELTIPAVWAVPWPDASGVQKGVLVGTAGPLATIATYTDGQWRQGQAWVPQGLAVAPGTTVQHRLLDDGTRVITTDST